MRLSEAVEAWCAQRLAEGYSHHTIDAYRLQMGLLQRALGDREIDQVTLADLRAYVAGATHLKASSVAHRVRMIRSFFHWLVEEEHLTRSPAMKLKEPKLPERLPKALPFEDLELIRDACKNPREHALIEFLFATGCRASELAGVTKRDIDWERRAVRVVGKGNKEREVYLGAKASLWLRRYLAERTDDCPYVFITERGPARQLHPHQLWWIIKQIADRVGLRTRTWPHVFRHTLATSLLNNGAPLVAVQSLLGHTKPETTQLYARLSGANRQQYHQRYFVQ